MLDAQGAYALLERVVAERGEHFVYNRQVPNGRCAYVHYDLCRPKPGCGIGLAATYLGTSFGEMERWDFLNLQACEIDLPGGATAEALEVLRDFQTLQDRGASYSMALSLAKQRLDEIEKSR